MGGACPRASTQRRLGAPDGEVAREQEDETADKIEDSGPHGMVELEQSGAMEAEELHKQRVPHQKEPDPSPRRLGEFERQRNDLVSHDRDPEGHEAEKSTNLVQQTLRLRVLVLGRISPHLPQRDSREEHAEE